MKSKLKLFRFSAMVPNPEYTAWENHTKIVGVDYDMAQAAAEPDIPPKTISKEFLVVAEDWLSAMILMEKDPEHTALIAVDKMADEVHVVGFTGIIQSQYDIWIGNPDCEVKRPIERCIATGVEAPTFRDACEKTFNDRKNFDKEHLAINGYKLFVNQKECDEAVDYLRMHHHVDEKGKK